MRLFGIYDKVSENYLSVFPAHTQKEAKRNVQMAFQNPQMKNSPLCQSPNDFELWELCYIEKDTVKDVSNECLGVIGSFVAIPIE